MTHPRLNTIAAATPEDWMADALCREVDGDLFFGEAKGDHYAHAAKAACARCPVTGPCLELALTNNEEHGVWGGTTPRERRAMRRKAS